MLFQSNAFFNGNCTLQHNHAENGGGLLSMESKLYVNSYVTIALTTQPQEMEEVFISQTVS